MTILVTGGAGFLGRAVHDQLQAARHPVRVFDRAADKRDDVLDHDRLLMAADGCEAVVHLAAKVGLGVDIFDIDEYALQNDVGTAITFEWRRNTRSRVWCMRRRWSSTAKGGTAAPGTDQ